MMPKKGEIWKNSIDQHLFVLFIGYEKPFSHEVVKFYWLEKPYEFAYTNVKEFEKGLYERVS